MDPHLSISNYLKGDTYRKMAEKSQIRSLSKAIDLLNLLLKKRTALSVPEFSRILKMGTSTAYKYLAVLKDKGFVEYDPKSRKFSLGLRLYEFGAFVQGQIEVNRVALPYMRSLSNITGETTILYVLYNKSSALCIERVEVEHERGIIFSVKKGTSIPLHIGASGKIFLALMPDKDIEEYLKNNELTRYTDNTITDPKELWENLMVIRKEGCACSDQEHDIGARAASAPIFDHEGRLIAGLTVAGPVQRMNSKKLREFKKLALEYSKKISLSLQGRDRGV